MACSMLQKFSVSFKYIISPLMQFYLGLRSLAMFLDNSVSNLKKIEQMTETVKTDKEREKYKRKALFLT